ncbi:root UVB sensitive protein (Protein of unknown function, DUF647) isoform X2 [Wolffia australiana]
MLGGILFTFYQGSNLDSHAKMWRLIADFMNDIGMLMDLISPLWPSALIPIVCIGSLSRSFTGVASGATRAALTQHFSLQNNAADISAKEGSQETVATMVGMALGMLLAQFTRGQPFVIWFSFLSLTMFHMFANYMAVRCLSLVTLNDERSWLLLKHFMKTGEALSPKQVSELEHVIPLWSLWSLDSDFLHKRINLGIKVSSLSHSDAMELLTLASSHYKTERYLLLERDGKIRVVMHRHSRPSDTLKSFIHALVLSDLSKGTKSAHVESVRWMKKHFPVFVEKLQLSGWTTERLLCHSIIWRADWVIDVSLDKNE